MSKFIVPESVDSARHNPRRRKRGATKDEHQNHPPLGLRPKDAARALGIGERLLWTLTNQGKIPHLRLGQAVVYPVHVLRDWLTEQSRGVKK